MCIAVLILLEACWALAQAPAPVSALTWEQIQEQFRRNNPNLVAGRTTVEEARTNEITAGLRPNPQLSLTINQRRLFQGNPCRPFGESQSIGQYSQLLERQNTELNYRNLIASYLSAVNHLNLAVGQEVLQ